MTNMKVVLTEEGGSFSMDSLRKIAATREVSTDTIRNEEDFEKLLSDFGGEELIVVVNNGSFDDKTARETERKIDERLQRILIMMGIPSHIKGCKFLKDAIKVAISSSDMINNITKGLYPSIAEKNNTSASKVERAIRHAIEVSWNRGKIENINSLFGLKVFAKGEKPTNGELIALIADKMLLDLAC